MTSATETLSGEGAVRTEFSTTDIDSAHGWLRETYNEYRPTQSRAPKGTLFRGTRHDLDTLTTSRLQFPMSADIHLPQVEILLVAQIAEGWYGYDTGQQQVRAHVGDSVLVPMGRDMRVTWSRLDIGALTLDPGDVARIASETAGIEPQELEFTGGLPVSGDAERHWRSTVSYVNRSVLPNPLAASSAIVRAEVARLLAVAMLSAFENTAMGHEARPDGLAVTPAALRRAVQYIDDAAHTDVTITQIAAAAGVGPRALQHAFRRHLDTTPTAYARRVRLEGAHRELLAADPGTGASVAEIAARWGFAHLGRFATSYRAAYGRLPRETLRS